MATGKQSADKFAHDSSIFNEKIVADKIGYVVVLMNLAGVTEKNHIH